MEQKTQNQLKVSDLRVGNWVDSERGLVQIATLELWDNRIGVKSPCFKNFVWCRCQGIKPIPLTEEWLLRFGFEIYDSGRHNSPHAIKETIRLSGIGGYNGDVEEFKITDKIYWFLSGYEHTEIQYVHQLQNLYHALTGEELIYEQE